MRNILFFVLFVLLLSAPALADGPAEAGELVKTKVNSVMEILKDKTLDKAGRDEQIIQIVTPIFDYRAMAKLSLGKKHWPQLSKENQSAFSELFIARLKKSFLEKLNIYTDEQIVYGEPQQKGKKVHVPTILISKDSRIEMLYKLYRKPEGWKVYDVEVGGVSVIQTYRSQFDDALNEGTIEGLLEKLKEDDSFAVSESDKSGARSEQN